MVDKTTIDKNKWEEGWEGHRKAQLMRWADLTFREKLLWLDEAQDQLLEMGHQSDEKKRS